MGLPRLDATSWPDEILAVAREFMNGVISVYLPGEPGEYDPIEDEVTVGDPIPVITSRPARIQHLRTPLSGDESFQWKTRRSIRFQVELMEGDPQIHKGMYVKVEDPGRDPALAAQTYPVLGAINSSHAALRTIEAVMEDA